jgi:hypothetical protein
MSRRAVALWLLVPMWLPTPSSGIATTSAGAFVGYVGCSNSSAAVRGARELAATNLWPPLRYGGGTVQRWARGLREPDARWGLFDETQALYPAKVFWLQLCELATEDDSRSLKAAVKVANAIRARVPGARVYVGAINGYVEPHVCSLLGSDGVANMERVAEELVSGGLALGGPDVGDLVSDEPVPSAGATPSNDETKSDGCHPNARGAAKLGGALVAFDPLGVG